MGVLSCVSIIVQSRAIDKVYLISRLHNVLHNELLLFEQTTFSEPLLCKGPYLYSFARATFSKDAVFQKNFQQLNSRSF